MGISMMKLENWEGEVRAINVMVREVSLSQRPLEGNLLCEIPKTTGFYVSGCQLKETFHVTERIGC